MLADNTLRAINTYADLCERAAAYPGRPRERMVALGEADELFFRLFSHHYRALQVVRVASQLGRSVHRRREPLQRCESRTAGLLSQVIADAVACGDLEMLPNQRSDDLAFSVWALVFGTRALMATTVATRQLGIEDGYPVALDAAGLLFDALGWRPLSDEWDYMHTRNRIRTEIFDKEWSQASAA
jgi:hypothetical protein